jgi:hypothetical protein
MGSTNHHVEKVVQPKLSKLSILRQKDPNKLFIFSQVIKGSYKQNFIKSFLLSLSHKVDPHLYQKTKSFMCIPRLINLHTLPTPYDTSGITCIMKWSNSQEIGQQDYISENQQLIYIISTCHSFTITSKMLFDIRL